MPYLDKNFTTQSLRTKLFAREAFNQEELFDLIIKIHQLKITHPELDWNEIRVLESFLTRSLDECK